MVCEGMGCGQLREMPVVRQIARLDTLLARREVQRRLIVLPCFTPLAQADGMARLKASKAEHLWLFWDSMPLRLS